MIDPRNVAWEARKTGSRLEKLYKELEELEPKKQDNYYFAFILQAVAFIRMCCFQILFGMSMIKNK